MAYIQIGAFAEYVVLKASRALKLPDHLDYEVGASFPVAGLTAWHVLHTVHNLREGQHVVVHAAGGGVGLAAVQIARAGGAHVIAITSSPEKSALALAAGADVVLSAAETLEDHVLRATHGKGADLILDSVGLPTLEAGLRALAPFGHLISFGEAGGRAPAISPRDLVPNSLRLSGFSLPMSYKHGHLHQRAAGEVVRLVSEGKLRLPIHQGLSFRYAADALRLISERQTVGKVVLVDRGNGAE